VFDFAVAGCILPLLLLPGANRAGFHRNVATIPPRVTLKLDRDTRDGIARYIEQLGGSHSEAIRTLIAFGLKEAATLDTVLVRRAWREGIVQAYAEVKRRILVAISEFENEAPK
jgi:hypothetical protein